MQPWEYFRSDVERTREWPYVGDSARYVDGERVQPLSLQMRADQYDAQRVMTHTDVRDLMLQQVHAAINKRELNLPAAAAERRIVRDRERAAARGISLRRYHKRLLRHPDNERTSRFLDDSAQNAPAEDHSNPRMVQALKDQDDRRLEHETRLGAQADIAFLEGVDEAGVHFSEAVRAGIEGREIDTSNAPPVIGMSTEGPVYGYGDVRARQPAASWQALTDQPYTWTRTEHQAALNMGAPVPQEGEVPLLGLKNWVDVSTEA